MLNLLREYDSRRVPGFCMSLDVSKVFIRRDPDGPEAAGKIHGAPVSETYKLFTDDQAPPEAVHKLREPGIEVIICQGAGE